jgi:dihydroxyacetone kinase
MSAEAVHAAMVAALQNCKDHEEELGLLDAAAGDGDHGSGMVRGFTAAWSATAGFCDSAASSIKAAGDAFADAAGGASGALWGAFLQTVGSELAEGKITGARVAGALRSGELRLESLGRSQPGDKTLLDTLVPFLDAFDRNLAEGQLLAAAWSGALGVAREATSATSNMIPKRGRSAVLGERSLGVIDPGSRSLLLVLEAVSPVIAASAGELA